MDMVPQEERRATWFSAVRNILDTLFHPDGSGKIPQFDPPYREPIWILPALYSGGQEHIDLANKIVARYNSAPEFGQQANTGAAPGANFNIFQSNDLAFALHHYGHLATDQAREVMAWHARALFRLHSGARQSDLKFHGANDNMPMNATLGHIMGGEALQDKEAVAHGVWMLHQFRRLLSRSAWASEFVSCTYSPLTIAAAAKIAEYSCDPEIRQLALDIEHRLWAELLLHFHPSTKQFSGPQSRMYMVDFAAHTHSLHALLWLIAGEDVSGRDPVRSYFHPDGKELFHFSGNPYQSIAEYCSLLEAVFHVPPELAQLAGQRRYPSRLRGRSEAMSSHGRGGASLATTTYMEEAFSLGSVDKLWIPNATSPLLATYKRKPEVHSFRDSGVVHVKYFCGDVDFGAAEVSKDGAFTGERETPSPGWVFTLQKDNVALVSATPAIDDVEGRRTAKLALSCIFPAHFGRISRCVIGNGEVQEGFSGESQSVECVSVEAGEVYINIVPLLPTCQHRSAALRLRRSNAYEILELINYEGPARTFTRSELSRMLNGLVFTIRAKNGQSLAEFHKESSAYMVQDYFGVSRRFLLFQRKDVEFEAVHTTDPFGIQTESIDGRQRPRPVFESDQLDVMKLPFMSGPVKPALLHFPWGDEMSIPAFPNTWLIGSRGDNNEIPYSRIREGSDLPA